MKKKRRLKKKVKIFTVLLAVLLFFTMVVPSVSYAKEALGKSIRVEKIDGTAKIINAKGKEMIAKEGVKLMAGQSLQTAKGSYAYLSLDESKVLKLDELSQIKINKDGRDLSIEVEEGELFFEVKEKLKNNESMEFSASTMAMSIRGTSGVISLRRVKDDAKIGVELLDGRVDMTYSDVKGKDHEFTMWGGEVVNHLEGSADLERDLIDVTSLEGFAAVEIVKNEALSKKLLEESGLNSNFIAENADRMLEVWQKYNGERYYDVFDPYNTSSIASLKLTDKVDAFKENVHKKKAAPAPVSRETKVVPTEKPAPSPSPEPTIDPNLIALWSQMLASTPTPTPTATPKAVPAPTPDTSSDEGSSDNNNQSDTPSEPQNNEPAPTPEATPEPTPEPTRTPTPTKTPTPEPTQTPMPGATPTPEPTRTPAPTATPAPTPTPTPMEEMTEWTIIYQFRDYDTYQVGDEIERKYFMGYKTDVEDWKTRSARLAADVEAPSKTFDGYRLVNSSVYTGRAEEYVIVIYIQYEKIDDGGSSSGTGTTYKVVFYDRDNETIVSTQMVEEGGSAVAPDLNIQSSYVWKAVDASDKITPRSYTNVTCDILVYPQAR